jgi:formylglycine-generating enzyme required for sulfatase activity
MKWTVLSILVAALIAAITVFAPGTGDAGAPGHPEAGGDLPRMALIPGGTFLMGRADGHPDEGPPHEVTLPDFALGVTEVTNRQFAAFVAATAHVTDAERSGGAWLWRDGETEFRFVRGADWRHPDGPRSSVEDRLDHPVVAVSHRDAEACARWLGMRLPTEAEWEYAARAGSGHRRAAVSAEEQARLSSPEGAHLLAANVWQGDWPRHNDLLDGHRTTAPVSSYPANAFGLVDMIGNVWEWCSDFYSPDAYARSLKEAPRGPVEGDRRVARGGSWFCSTSYCGAYSTWFRGASPEDRGFSNVGFRVAADAGKASADRGGAR